MVTRTHSYKTVIMAFMKLKVDHFHNVFFFAARSIFICLELLEQNWNKKYFQRKYMCKAIFENILGRPNKQFYVQCTVIAFSKIIKEFGLVSTAKRTWVPRFQVSGRPNLKQCCKRLAIFSTSLRSSCVALAQCHGDGRH